MINRFAFLFTAGETNVDGKTIQVDPVFNLGESLRRLYFPNEYRSKNKKKLSKESKDTVKGDSEVEPMSDPEGCASLYKKISTMYGLRRVQSTPEFEGSQPVPNDVEIYDYSTFSKSKSLPNTPKVSPKLLRKNKTTDEIPDGRQIMDPSGPGFSFLASVAGDVRMYKAKQEQLRQEEKRKYEAKMALAKTTSERSVDVTRTERNDNSNTSTKVSSATADMIGHRPRSYSNESDSDSESSLVKNIISWGTKKRVPMSGKEANMWSPTSF